MADKLLGVVSLVADGLSVLAFVGLSDSRDARIAVGAVFAGVAVFAGGYFLWRAIALYLSPDGALYPNSYHVRRASSAFAVLILAGAVGAVTITVAASSGKKKPGKASAHASLAVSSARPLGTDWYAT
jgi:hypothetical protein